MSAPSAATAVTVVVLTHQFERWIARAVDSALAQRHPRARLEVIVVDDGSTDATARILDGYGDEIRVLRHPNAGSARSLERGLLAARGEVIVTLDGDDELHPELVPRQLERLRARPEVGLCAVDRRVVDVDGRVVEPSFARANGSDPARPPRLGELVVANSLTLSGMALRAALLPHVLPFAEDAPAEDWWLAVAVARQAQLDRIDAPLVDYRRHGANRNLGNDAAANAPLFRRDLRFRRRLLRELWCSPQVAAADLVAACAALLEWAAIVERQQAGAAAAALPVGDGARRARDGYLARAAAADDGEELVRLGAAALGHDPFDARAVDCVRDGWQRLGGSVELRPPAAPAAPVPPAASAGAPPAALTTVRVEGHGELGVPQERLWAFPGGRYYEHSVTHWLERMLADRPDPVLYDVGSNIGYYPVRFGAAASRVYAFEPVGGTFATMRANVERNGLDHVVPLQLALSDADGTAEIDIWSSSGSNTLYRRRFGADHPHTLLGSETIELARLDRLTAAGELAPPDVVKIDVEGAELAALRGAAETLSRHRPLVLVECEADACRDAGYAPQELHAELRRHGYALFGLHRDPRELRPQPLDGSVDVANLVALPHGSPLLRAVVSELLGGAVRERLTVAWVEDVLADPEPLRAYAAATGAADDATLVLWAPGRPDLLERLVALVGRLGLDGDGAPDMLGCDVDERTVGHALGEAAAAVIGRPAPPSFRRLAAAAATAA